MKKRIPPGQIIITGFPVRTAESSLAHIDPDRWSLSITGLVDNDIIIPFKEIQSMKLSEVKSDFHCVEKWSIPDNRWKGVKIKNLFNKISIKPEARFAMVYSWGGYDSDIDLDALLHENTILAWERNGKPIEPEHGYPLRLIIPDRYAYKSVKWVVEIELMSEDTPGYWERRGYHMRADVWAQERFLTKK